MRWFGRKRKQEAKDPVVEAREYYLKDNFILSEATLARAGFSNAEIGEFYQNWGREAAIGGAISGGSNGRTGHERPDENEGRERKPTVIIGQRKSSKSIGARLQSYLFGEPRKPSMGINLAPTKKQLQAYRDAEGAYLTGDTDSGSILRQAGYNDRTISELGRKWDRKRDRFFAIEAAKEAAMRSDDREAFRILQQAGVTFRQSDKLTAAWYQEKAGQRRQTVDLAWRQYRRGKPDDASKILNESGYSEEERDALFKDWDESIDRTSKIDRRFYKIAGALLFTGALIAAGSISYQYIKPYFSQQVSIQRPAQTAQQKPEAKPAQPASERPIVPSVKAEPKPQEKTAFYAPIAQTGTTSAPSTTAPAQPRTEQPVPQSISPRRPEELPKIAYMGETGRKREVAIYEVPWLITKIGEERRGEYSDIVLEAFYDEDKDGDRARYEPFVNLRIRDQTQADAKETIAYVNRCLAEKKKPHVGFSLGQGYVNLSGNNLTDIVASKNRISFKVCE